MQCSLILLPKQVKNLLLKTVSLQKFFDDHSRSADECVKIIGHDHWEHLLRESKTDSNVLKSSKLQPYKETGTQQKEIFFGRMKETSKD